MGLFHLGRHRDSTGLVGARHAQLKPRLPSHWPLTVAILTTIGTAVRPVQAQSDEPPTPIATIESAGPATGPARFKRMNLDELMNVEVISVSRRPEPLGETASAVQIVTGEQIRRSGATNLVEALRLAPNLRVAQANSYAWVVSARGFSALFSNKLLVMIDGRTVYTPLFAGVQWDVQNLVLEDIDRIEVVSGPGGSLWGANAVNGVINVVTKSARETQGAYVSTTGGTFLHDAESFRYGGQIGTDLYYRVYAQHFNRDNTFLGTGEDNTDEWYLTHGGFRLDYYPSHDNTFTLQGDFYGGTQKTTPDDSAVDGQYLLGRWTHTISDRSDLTVQLYVDRTWRRDVPSTFTDSLQTYDLDVQHRFPIGERHSFLWGVGYRFMQSEITNSTAFGGFVPRRRDLELVSAFIQDEITLVPDRWKLTLGSKFEYHDFSGFEVQPSARVAWTPDDRQTIWAAVSRAVRSPSRIDVDLHIPAFPLPPDQPSVAGGPNFDSEKMIAYEAGYRLQPASNLSMAVAVFYNSYDDLYGVEALPGTQTFQVQNISEGQSWGAELSFAYQPADWVTLRGGYTYFESDLWNKPGHDSPTAALGNDPQHQLLLHAMFDLPGDFQFDVLGRYTSELPDPEIPSYVMLNARLAKSFGNVELAIVGQNLLDDRHTEFSDVEIPRSIYGKVTVRW